MPQNVRPIFAAPYILFSQGFHLRAYTGKCYHVCQRLLDIPIYRWILMPVYGKQLTAQTSPAWHFQFEVRPFAHLETGRQCIYVCTVPSRRVLCSTKTSHRFVFSSAATGWQSSVLDLDRIGKSCRLCQEMFTN